MKHTLRFRAYLPDDVASEAWQHIDTLRQIRFRERELADDASGAGGRRLCTPKDPVGFVASVTESEFITTWYSNLSCRTVR